MKKIVVATDFSERSDRAIRRATLLAKTFDVSVSLVHVVDDDKPRRVVRTAERIAREILDEQVSSLRQIDGLECDHQIVLGDSFEGILKAAQDMGADMLIIGPHRRDKLKEVFIGTTAERTIRASDRPVLMANGVPSGAYRHALVAVDLSDSSAAAAQSLRTLGLDGEVRVSVVHAFNAPALSAMRRASATEDQIKDYVLDEEQHVAGELKSFLANLNVNPSHTVVMPIDSSAADTICAVAKDVSADLIVVGTHGLSGVLRAMLGSVAERVLRISKKDVLVVP